MTSRWHTGTAARRRGTQPQSSIWRIPCADSGDCISWDVGTSLRFATEGVAQEHAL